MATSTPPFVPVSPERAKKWTCIYPCYLNYNKSVAEGRRLPKAKLEGCEDPTWKDIVDACITLSIEGVVEPKRHPRDWAMAGRVRFMLKKADGTLANPAYAKKDDVLEAIARVIPTLPGRQERLRAQSAAAAAPVPSSPPPAPAASGKKGGKKGKR